MQAKSSACSKIGLRGGEGLPGFESSVTSRPRHARRRTFTAASSSANLYAHVSNRLSPRKSSSRRRIETSPRRSPPRARGRRARRARARGACRAAGRPRTAQRAGGAHAGGQPPRPCAGRRRGGRDTSPREPEMLQVRSCQVLVSWEGTVLPSYLRGAELGRGKRDGALGHRAVALSDAALGVRRPAHGDLAVADVDVRDGGSRSPRPRQAGRRTRSPSGTTRTRTRARARRPAPPSRPSRHHSTRATVCASRGVAQPG